MSVVMEVRFSIGFCFITEKERFIFLNLTSFYIYRSLERIGQGGEFPHSPNVNTTHSYVMFIQMKKNPGYATIN